MIARELSRDDKRGVFYETEINVFYSKVSRHVMLIK